jgi:hypothetical protein
MDGRWKMGREREMRINRLRAKGKQPLAPISPSMVVAAMVVFAIVVFAMIVVAGTVAAAMV